MNRNPPSVFNTNKGSTTGNAATVTIAARTNHPARVRSVFASYDLTTATGLLTIADTTTTYANYYIQGADQLRFEDWECETNGPVIVTLAGFTGAIAAVTVELY